MLKMKRIGLIVIAGLLSLCLCAAALAEDTETPAAQTDTVSSSEALASADALKEALSALESARKNSRKQALLDALKKELDGYVANGKLTQAQADMILQYYAEQMTLQEDGRDRGNKCPHPGCNRRNRQPNVFKDGRNNQDKKQKDSGKDSRNSQDRKQHGFGWNGHDSQDSDQNDSGWNNRHNRFSNPPKDSDNSAPDANTTATPKANPQS